VSTIRLAVVGDALLDRDVEGDVRRLAPDAPVPVVDQRAVVVRPGGAGLAALLSARGGHTVRLVTALAPDAAGAELRAALERAGVEVVDVGLDGATPEKIRVRAQGRALLRLDRGGDGGTVGAVTGAARAAIAWADAILVADYGRGVAAESGIREALDRAVAGGVPVVWDPHPRGPQPIAGATLATPNHGEARTFAGAAATGATSDLAAAAKAGEALRTAWGAANVCVTRGADGALLVTGASTPLVIPAQRVPVGDPCGAGDRFASRAAEALGTGAPVPEAVTAAVTAASAFVAAGGASAIGALRRDRPHAAAPDPRAVPRAGSCAPRGRADGPGVVERVRAQGGTVVATGGCFDLLHPGHVHTLQAARALGDCLVVCLNSDASVRRLKGPSRPVQSQDDRAAVLTALGCVDAVVVFDEDTPTEVLRTIRPEVWVKGGDYAVADLPEAAVLAEWGGRAAVLPFVAGRSTTRLIEEASLHAVRRPDRHRARRHHQQPAGRARHRHRHRRRLRPGPRGRRQGRRRRRHAGRARPRRAGGRP
jgi:D-beta-D-heptose 7-phosphate kinase/D-beta-D-heptose 1-phosphate adenosyltransferase